MPMTKEQSYLVSDTFFYLQPGVVRTIHRATIPDDEASGITDKLLRRTVLAMKNNPDPRALAVAVLSSTRVACIYADRVSESANVQIFAVGSQTDAENVGRHLRQMADEVMGKTPHL